MRLRLTLILVMLVAASGLIAQTFRGGIQGTVIDKTGAAVPNAQVSIVNTDTGLTRKTQTDTAGNYVATELPIGNYNVAVTAPGFGSQTATGVRVVLTPIARVNFTLNPGEVKENVVVTAEVPLVNSSDTTLGGTIPAQQVQQLPVNGRDFLKLLTMVPGSTADASGEADSPGSFGMFSINGNRGRSNNYLLDGTDMNDGYRNLPAINEPGVFGTPATVLPLDALAEVPVMTDVQAEYGRNSGGIVNLVTKSGTNEVHGSLYEYFRNNWLDARNFFNFAPNPAAGLLPCSTSPTPPCGQPQDLFINNQFGGSLGGPISKDRTFFFAAYEGQRERAGIPFTNSVPTQAMVNDFLASGGIINPVIAKLMARGPWTNGGPLPASAPATCGTPPCPAPFQQDVNSTNRVDSLILKVDHHFGGHERHDLFTSRYYFGDSDQSFPLGLVGGNVMPGYNTVTPTRVQIVSLSLTHIITPRLLLEFRGGYNRFAEEFLPQDRSFNPNTIGLNTTGNPQDFGLPFIAVSGLASIGSNVANPRGRVDTNWQYFTNASYTTGQHAFKWGYEFRRTSVNQFFDEGFRGKLGFSSFADFLSGTIDSGRQAAGDTRRHTFENNQAFYFQDGWKIASRLTLNYGVRWDYFGVIGEKDDLFSLFDPTRGLVTVGSPTCGAGAVCPKGPDKLYPRDLNNFAPRLGLVIDPTGSGKTVVRAGWGLYYDAFSQDFFAGQIPFNTFNAGAAYNGIGPAPVLFSFSPVSTIQAGVPVFSDFSATDVFTVSQKLSTPYVQNYNLNVQRELGPHASMMVGYAGSTGRKLFRFRDINQAIGSTFDPAGSGCSSGSPLDQSCYTNVHPFDSVKNPSASSFGYINQLETTSNSVYNSLQMQMKMRNLHGVTSTVNYTWGHSIDNASDGQDYVPNASQPDNSFNPAGERASSNFDTRHRFTWYFTYEFPNFARAPKLTNGWAMDGVLTLASGMPVNVTWLFEGDYNGTGEFFGRPDLVGDPHAGTSLPNNWLNASAVAVPCTWSAGFGACIHGTQHIGNIGRNAFVGPGLRNFDLSLSKNTRMTERVTMQLRVDFFNVFNHPNFSNPLLPNFGVDFLATPQNANVAPDARGRGVGFIPIIATPDVGIGDPFLGGGGPRNLQLAARFSF